MSHEMQSNDHAVFAGRSAWHGLGTTVETAPTPGQALTLAKLDWQVIESDGLFADHTEQGAAGSEKTKRTAIHTHKALLRSDDWSILSVLGKNYEVLQNDSLAEFCYALADEDDTVRVESAGSLRGGRRIWFLLRGESLTVGSDADIVEPYILAYNSHDGSSAVEFMDTKIRVVCNNTLTAARRGAKDQTFKFRHTGSLLDRVGAATSVMRKRFQGMKDWADAIMANSRPMTVAQVNEYFDNTFNALWTDRATTEQAKLTRANKQRTTVAEWQDRFDSERSEHGLEANNWTAANAVTHWLDHKTPVVQRTDSKHNSTTEARAFNNLFGTTAHKKATAFHLAGLPTA